MRIPEQLPNLQGRWLSAYRALWFVMLLIALATLPLQVQRSVEDKRLNEQFYSFGILGIPEGGVRKWTAISDLPATRDLVPGSTVVKLDGEPVEETLEGFQQMAMQLTRTGDTVDLDLMDPAGRPYSMTIARDPAYLAQMNERTGVSFDTRHYVRTGFGLLIDLMAIAVAVLLYRRRVREPVPAYLSIGLLGFVAQFMGLALPGLAAANILLGFIVTVFIIPLTFAFLTFPDGKLRPKLVLVLLAVALVYDALGIFDSFGGDVAWAGSIIQLMFLFLLVGLITLLIFKFRRAEISVRQQLKWAILGFGGFALFQSFGILFANIPTDNVGSVLKVLLQFANNLAVFASMICMLGGLLISLLRFRLYDAEAAIGNSVWVGALTISLLLIFAGSEKLFEVVGERIFGAEMGIASGAIAAGLAAILAGPLYTRLHRWAERTFQRDMVRLRDGLPALVGDLRETEDPKALATTALDRIDQGVRAGGYALVFADGEERIILATRETTETQVADWLADNALPIGTMEIVGQDEIFPIRVLLRGDGIDFEAALLVGRRPDGTMIGKDERNALLTIADPLARALAISLRRTRRIDEERAERSSLKKRIARLEELIAKKPKPDPA